MNFFFRILLIALLLFPGRSQAVVSLTEGALIRDAEIEAILKSYIEPLFKVAGLDPKSLHLYVINSKEINAFAMGGGRIGIHTGLIVKATTAMQVMGVLAHETAHLAGNHIIRGMESYEKALLKSLLGILGGVAAGAAGSPEAAAAILLGSQEMAKQGFLQFTRSQESAADQGATRFLDALGYPSNGLVEFMETLRKEDPLMEIDVDPYARTHPLTTDRIEYFRIHAESSPHAHKSPPPALQKDFNRMKAKIEAFTQSPTKIMGKYGPGDQSFVARYARAIAYFQGSRIDESLREIESLLAEAPHDAYVWDLKGQVLFDSGRIAEAANAYAEAVKLQPNTPLLRISYAHALIESGQSHQIDQALQELLRAKNEEPENPFTYRLLAVCYGKKGNTGLAALSLAEMGMEVEDYVFAEAQANRALKLFSANSPEKARADHILEEISRIKSL